MAVSELSDEDWYALRCAFYSERAFEWLKAKSLLCDTGIGLLELFRTHYRWFSDLAEKRQAETHSTWDLSVFDCYLDQGRSHINEKLQQYWRKRSQMPESWHRDPDHPEKLQFDLSQIIGEFNFLLDLITKIALAQESPV